MRLFRSNQVGDESKKPVETNATGTNSNREREQPTSTTVHIENTGHSSAIDERPANTATPQREGGRGYKSWRDRSSLCTKQGPKTANHCACFNTSPQQVARVAAKVSIMMNIIPVFYIILTLRMIEEDLSIGQVYGSIVFIVCTVILIGLSALLIVGISKKKPRLGIPWIVCQTLMLVFILGLAVINYRNYEKSVSEHNRRARNSTVGPASTTTTTDLPNLNGTSASTSTPSSNTSTIGTSTSTTPPTNDHETTNPLAIVYLAIIYYLSYHILVVVCLIWMVVNFFVGLTCARGGLSSKGDDETPPTPIPIQQEAPGSPDSTAGASPRPDPSSTPEPHTATAKTAPTPEIDPDALLRETQNSKFHEHEIELDDEEDNEV